jgi:hypothetical protein
MNELRIGQCSVEGNWEGLIPYSVSVKREKMGVVRFDVVEYQYPGYVSLLGRRNCPVLTDTGVSPNTISR